MVVHEKEEFDFPQFEDVYGSDLVRSSEREGRSGMMGGAMRERGRVV